jgi:hypothetical protein
MSPPLKLDRLSHADLKDLVLKLLEEVAELRRTVAAQRDEIARLKGGSGRPNIKPSGMDKATEPKPSPAGDEPRQKDSKTSKLTIHEERTVTLMTPPQGSRFKGYTDFVVAANGFCTHIGNEHFAWFGTTGSKNRGNFLDLLRAGHDDYVINAEALAYMRQRNLSGLVITRLAEPPDQAFADHAAWTAHLDRLGILALKVHPDPVMIATEGALWGSIKAHGFLPDTVIVSDDAGQFNVGQHGLCWVHAERLVHTLDTFTDEQREAQASIRELIWSLYRDLKAYRQNPSRQRRTVLRARFDRIFTRKTGFVTLDRLLARLHANKRELLMVLDRPEIPLHTNGSENDVRCQVTKRKVSGGTRSDMGRDCRDAFLGLNKTCAKLGIAFWDYLGSRLSVPNQAQVPHLPASIKHRCATA